MFLIINRGNEHNSNVFEQKSQEMTITSTICEKWTSVPLYVRHGLMLKFIQNWHKGLKYMLECA